LGAHPYIPRFYLEAHVPIGGARKVSKGVPLSKKKIGITYNTQSYHGKCLELPDTSDFVVLKKFEN
jgi:hypothetical protein